MSEPKEIAGQEFTFPDASGYLLSAEQYRDFLAMREWWKQSLHYAFVKAGEAAETDEGWGIDQSTVRFEEPK